MLEKRQIFLYLTQFITAMLIQLLTLRLRFMTSALEGDWFNVLTADGCFPVVHVQLWNVIWRAGHKIGIHVVGDDQSLHGWLHIY